jgi:hypothetical protein
VHTGFCWQNQKEEITGKPRYRWEDNIKMDLTRYRNGEWGCVEWIDLTENRD